MGTSDATASDSGLVTLPVIPVETTIILPYSVDNINITSPEVIGLLNRGSPQGEMFALALSRDMDLPPGLDNLEPVAVAARCLSRITQPDGRIQVLFRGEYRIRLEALFSDNPWLTAETIKVDQVYCPEEGISGELTGRALQLLETLISMDSSLPAELGQILQQNSGDQIRFPDIIAAALDFDLEGRRRLLLALHPSERLSIVCELISQKIENSVHQEQLLRRTRERVEKSRREAWLRQQLAVIQEQLGDEGADDFSHYQRRLEEEDLPEKARSEGLRELARLRRIPSASTESGVARNWLEFLLDLPWNRCAAEPSPYGKVREILARYHFGLEEVKERIAEEIAVIRGGGSGRGSVLCFAGPPGTGKTSLGRAIAEALGRPYYRIALGGMRDESEIRGHRRTYVGAMPGRILQGLRRVQAKDPVFLIDEVDKLGVGYQGDPAAALLEVLDPEQNRFFTDHYLGVPFDLSRVVFLATANVAQAIPPALLDRLEVINLPGYTEEEKTEICTRYLVPQAQDDQGLPRGAFTLTRPTARRIIRHYTRESGVRSLRRCVEKISRRAAVLRMEDKDAILKVRVKNLAAILGPPRLRRGRDRPREGVGLACGMAWTPTGGELLPVEAVIVPGRGREVITGHLGKVMKESVHTALTLVRARWRRLGIKPDLMKRIDIHIHFPAGAIPKDGPSAGVAVAVSLASALNGKVPAVGFAMTGEASLRGRVLPVGGIRDKVLAAVRAGIKAIILPRGNQVDLEKLSGGSLKGMTVHLVERIDQVFDLVFPMKRKRRPGGRG